MKPHLKIRGIVARYHGMNVTFKGQAGIPQRANAIERLQSASHANSVDAHSGELNEMKTSVLSLLMLCILAEGAVAVEPLTLKLWPDRPPTAMALKSDATVKLIQSYGGTGPHRVTDVSDPTSGGRDEVSSVLYGGSAVRAFASVPDDRTLGRLRRLLR